MLLVLFQVGCFSYLPLQTDRPQSSDVRVVLNERGQLDAAAGLGPFVESVEGIVAGQDSATVRLKVSRVVYARGGSALWTGEEVEIPVAGIAGFQARQFSKARTWALVGATVGIVAFSILTLNLDFFGLERTGRCTGTNCDENEQ